MKTFNEAMEQVAEALAKYYGQQFESMFSYFYAGDIDEMTPVNVGIVITGKRTQGLEDYIAELYRWARKVSGQSFCFEIFSEEDYQTWAEELDFGRFYWLHGAKSDLDLAAASVICYEFDENTPESEWIM